MSARQHHRADPQRRGSSRRQGRRRLADRAAFLGTISELLSGSLDVETTLGSIASLALPHDGGWCLVDIVEGGALRRVAVLHTDPALQKVARGIEVGWMSAADHPFSAARAMASRVSEIVGPVTREMLVAASSTPAILDALTRLDIGSLLVVPLIGRTEVIGAITYVSPVRSRVFETSDVAFAEEVAHRAARAIENARLYSSAKDAERTANEANQGKMAFLANLSHELRTPLNAISGYATLLADGMRGPLTDAQSSDVRRIQANEQHLLGLVDSVISYTRLEAGRMEYALEDCAMAHVLLEVQAIVGPMAAAKGIAYEVLATAGPRIVVHADPGKLRQILVNLVGNAVKFSKSGATIAVTSRVEAGLGLVSVADSGVGLGVGKLETIFHPFVQAHRRGTAGEEGSGLGLAISRRLARDMGGELRVESTPGTGSTFTLSLPLAGPGRPAAA